MTSKHFALSLFLASSFAIGCDDSEKKNPASQDMTVKVAPADPGNAPQPASQAPPTTSPAPAPSTGERLSADGVFWEMPAGWAKAPDAPMRLMTISDGQAEIAITSFNGDVGGTLLNVNRWLGQIGLPPVASEADAEKLMTEVDAAGVKVRTLDLVGQRRMLVAIVPAKGKLFFFKMMASPDLVAARKEMFTNLVKTIRVD